MKAITIKNEEGRDLIDAAQSGSSRGDPFASKGSLGGGLHNVVEKGEG